MIGHLAATVVAFTAWSVARPVMLGVEFRQFCRDNPELLHGRDAREAVEQVIAEITAGV